MRFVIHGASVKIIIFFYALGKALDSDSFYMYAKKTKDTRIESEKIENTLDKITLHEYL